MKRAMFACIMAAASSAALAQNYKRTDTGIVVDAGNWSAGTARGPTATASSGVTEARPITVAAAAQPDGAARSRSRAASLSAETPGTVTLSTGNAFADVDLATGKVSFRDAAGRVVLEQSGPPTFKPVIAEGTPWLSISQQFNRGTDEGFYGLGQHQNGQMNYNGEDVELAQHNMDVAIPFVVSTRNYGLLWDNNSVTRFGDPEPYTYAGAPDDGLQVNGGSGWTATYSVNGKTIAERQEPTIQLAISRRRERWPAGTRERRHAAAPSPAFTSPGQARSPRAPAGCTASVSMVRAISRCSSTARRCSTAGARTGIPGTTISTSSSPPARLTSCASSGSRTPATSRCCTTIRGPKPDRHSLTLTSDFARGVDYYFVPGSEHGRGDRRLPLADRQSADHAEMGLRLLAEPPALRDAGPAARGAPRISQARPPARQYRAGLALLAEDQWGCQCFDPARFPDPKAMVDEIHANGAHVMISVWAKYYKGIPNYKRWTRSAASTDRMVTPRPDEPKDPNYIKGDVPRLGRAGLFQRLLRRLQSRGARPLLEPGARRASRARASTPGGSIPTSPISTRTSRQPRPQRRMGPTALGPARALLQLISAGARRRTSTTIRSPTSPTSARSS